MQSPVPTSSTVRYTIQSSDVLSQNRINISEEKSERVIWYKERFLTDDEIVENVIDNATTTVLWEIHRPLRGWYIRLRSPRFPRNIFVSLVPVPTSSPYHSPGSLKFSCRANAMPTSASASASASSAASPSTHSSPSSRLPEASHSLTDSEVTLTDAPNGQFSPTHTYPPAPTPPRVAVPPPPSPHTVHARLNLLAQPRLVISHFILSPHAHGTATTSATEGLFSRALRALRNNAPTHTNSFSLSPLPPDGSPPTPAEQPPLRISGAATSHAPLLTFEDTTPVFSVGSSTGVLEVHLDEIRKLKVDLAFWIAVALAYGGFLGDREGYLAAVTD